MAQSTNKRQTKTGGIFSIGLVAMVLLSFPGHPTLDKELNDKNYAAWKNHIQPTSDELAWQKINWLPDLKSGINEATKSGKPILLWTMNGHPFGCT